jgi:hypothetical protein
LGSLLCAQPPVRWKDSEEDTFQREIHNLVLRFKGLESIAFENTPPTDFAEAFHLSLTKSDGSEAREVVFVEKDSISDVDALASEIQELVDRDRAVGIAALSRVVWSALKKD